ncbi:hypothetical protein BGZ47_005159 [Haplosporangium gracile]|nr:hypothetical protein BGZ47_005159 [Haplosporangium gracile]
MYQAFQGPNGRLEHLGVIYHTHSDQNVVFMDDIESLFLGFSALKKGPVTRHQGQGCQLQIYQPDIALKVVAKEKLSSAVDSVAAQTPSSSGTYTQTSQDRYGLHHEPCA